MGQHGTDQEGGQKKKKLDLSAIKAGITDRVEIKSCGFGKIIQELRL